MGAGLAVFGIIFAAELGDKTQLLLVTLGARHQAWKRVFLGAALAFLLLNVIAVAVGTVLYETLPLRLLEVLAGAALITFGLSSFKKQAEQGTADVQRSPFLKGFGLLAVMELGDKTQLSLLALAARYGAPVAAFLGATAALWLSSLLALLLGRWLGGRVPLAKLRLISGVVFIVLGIALIMGIA
ncbi:MAG: TMEM165/GDT1 family protein [Candidatus Geothermincolia bacterium]